jgi:hypothetical protein
MFKKKKTVKMLARIKLQDYYITETQCNELESLGVVINKKYAEDYTPGTYYEQWKDKTDKERDVEGERLFREDCKKGIPIRTTEIVVDLELFVSNLPTIPFTYIAPVYALL